MTIVLVPNFVLTGIHYHSGEKEILEEQPIFILYSVEEAMTRGKNSDLFNLLHSYVVFGIERHEGSCFLTNMLMISAMQLSIMSPYVIC